VSKDHYVTHDSYMTFVHARKVICTKKGFPVSEKERLLNFTTHSNWLKICSNSQNNVAINIDCFNVVLLYQQKTAENFTSQKTHFV